MDVIGSIMSLMLYIVFFLHLRHVNVRIEQYHSHVLKSFLLSYIIMHYLLLLFYHRRDSKRMILEEKKRSDSCEIVRVLLLIMKFNYIVN